MGSTSNGVLKASLWLQAAALLVLTSLLADASAWIGVIVTAAGFSFVIVGIGAAHKQSLGYLYCYATLVGVWELLAIVHTLILCDLIVLPEELIEPSLIVGQKVVSGAKDPSQTVIPSLYAVQGGGWCISLVTLVCLRVAVQDLALGFEIQNGTQMSTMAAKTAKRVHLIESAARRTSYRHPENTPRSSGRLSQRFFSFGSLSSVAPAPAEEFFGDPTVGSRTSTIGDNNIDKAKEYDSHLQKYKSWTGTEKRISLDSNIIYYPSHQRISQVTVTFRDESNPVQVAQPSRPIDAGTVFINNHNYDLGELEFDQPGESLSEVIFKAVSSTNAEKIKEAVSSIPSKAVVQVRMSDDSEDRSETETKAESPTLSAATTLEQDYAVAVADLSIAHLQEPLPSANVDPYRDQIEQMEKLQRLRQQYQPAWQIMKRQDDEEGKDDGKEEKTHYPSQSSFFSTHPPIIVPIRRSSVNGYSPLQSSNTEDSGSPVESVSDRIRFAPLPTPTIRQNQTLPLESNDEIPDQGVATVRSTSSSQARTTKPSLASLPLQYWRNRSNTGPEDTTNASSPSTPTNSTPFNLVNTFAKKMKQGTETLTTPPIPMMIPQIVLHPDEEDGEPARVLSERDIEYLSTMPPAPLRQLMQQYDDEDPGDDEEDYYAHDGNEGYDYDDYHHSNQDDYDEHDQDDGEFEVEDEVPHQHYHHHHQQQLPQLTEVDDDVVEPQVGAQKKFGEESKRGAETEYDPYALDVPINLEIDLQELEQQGDIKIGYGYV